MSLLSARRARRARRLRTAVPLACLAILAALAGLPVACAGPGDGRVVRYDDFVTDRADLPAGGEDPRAQLPCADETHYVRPLEPGERLRLPVEFGERPRLVLTFCRRADGDGTLRVRAEALRTEAQGSEAQGSDAPVEAAAEVAGHPRWQRWELDLSPLAGRAGTVTLSVELPPERRLLLRDAYVVHHTPTAAGWPRPGVHVEGEGSAPPESVPEPAAGDRRSGSGAQILLVSVDTLRADAIGALSGRPAADSPTPHLDRLIADGEVFTPHHAGASWTKPSHAVLLTGFPSSVHGANGPEDVLLPGLPTLAQRMAEAGLATGGLVHNCVWLNPKFGFHRGFRDYRSTKWRTGQLARGAVNWLAAHRGEPFFFFLHTFDPHSDFHLLPYEGAGASLWTVTRRFGVPGYGCRQGHCASGLLDALLHDRLEPLPREDEILAYLYDAGVRETDALLGRLLDDLRRLGLYDAMTIVVTSDHGEMLLEHGDTLHGRPWEQVMRVPLIVKWPRGERAGRVTTVPTSSLDVAPTLLALAGGDAAGLPGNDLRRLRPERTLISGTPGWWAVYDGGWKAVLYPDAGRNRLFHLAADPGEEHDLAAERPDELARLQERLDAFLAWSEATRARHARGDGSRQRELTAEEEERLRALGYLN